MSLNRNSINLIKQFEGLELQAYRDPVGIWTIGYGHTNAAGGLRVTPVLRITAEQAERILRDDLHQYEQAVDAAVTVPLNANQRGALVSFCYNVGPGNFRRSSVLRHVNAGRFDGVPHRLSLWNKAGGKVLRGLVRRRAAEGELFMTPVAPDGREQAGSQPIEQQTGKHPIASTTNIAATAGGAAAIASNVDAVRDTVSSVSGLVGLEPKWLFIAIALAAAAWIIRERWLKSRTEGV